MAFKPGQSGNPAGRPKGVPNKATAELKELAQSYAPDVVAELFRLAQNAESESARVSAIKELLDRGFGKAVQSVEVDANIEAALSVVERRIVRPDNPNG